MMRLPLSVTLLMAMAFLLAAGCSGGRSRRPADDGKTTVAVSIAPLGFMVGNIGGDRVNVVCVAPSTADPETFEPSMSNLIDASAADLWLTTGLLPFEERFGQMLHNENPAMTTAVMADSIVLIEGSHGDEADPHIWASLRNARILARNTLRALTDVAPADSAYFRTRWAALDHRLDSLDRMLSARLAPYSGATFLVWHPSLSYFARDYNLRQLAIGAENKEPSVTGLRRRLEQAATTDVSAFFFQQEFDSRQSEVVTSATGLRPVAIAPMDSDITRPLISAADAIISSKPKRHGITADTPH